MQELYYGSNVLILTPEIRVFASLNAFEVGFMDKATLLAELRTWVYVNQILFHTQKSLQLLTFKKEIRV